MIRKVRNCCETCENLVCVATTIGQLQHTEYLKPTFLDTFEWAIRPVFPETVTYVINMHWLSFYLRCESGTYIIIYIYSPVGSLGCGVYTLYATSGAFEVSRDHGIYIYIYNTYKLFIIPYG